MGEALKAPGQPFTFGGVARYATASIGRLLALCLPFAFAATLAIGWLAAHCWWPVITEAVAALPENARIAEGILALGDENARVLAANEFLSLQMAVGDRAADKGPADISLELGRYELVASSLFGDSLLPYPTGWTIRLDRASLAPFWGAWKAPILFAFGGLALCALIANWFFLALFYAPFAFFFGRIAQRQLSFGGAWKLCVAAQWPASLLMTFAIALYATAQIGLPFIVIMAGAHFIPSLLNVGISPFFLPKEAENEEGEPAKNERKARIRSSPRTKRESLKPNPFSPEKRGRRSVRNPFGE